MIEEAIVAAPEVRCEIAAAVRHSLSAYLRVSQDTRRRPRRGSDACGAAQGRATLLKIRIIVALPIESS